MPIRSLSLNKLFLALASPLIGLWVLAWIAVSHQPFVSLSEESILEQQIYKAHKEYANHHQHHHVDNDKNHKKTKRIIIVGGGAAGLTAAKRLVLAKPANHHLQVQILEAGEGFGGRVQKDFTHFAPYPIDLGASWVYDPQHLALMAQYSRYSPQWHALQKKTVSPVTAVQDFQSFKIHKDGRHSKMHMHSDHDHLWIDYSWYDYLKDHLVEPSLEAGLKLHTKCKVESILAQDEKNHHNQQEHHSEHPIQVQSTCGEFWADHVIVTVPLQILHDQDIAFSPPLSSHLIHTLHKRKMWQGFKIFLEFSEQFYHDYFVWSPDDGELDFWDYGLVMPQQKRHENQKRHILAGYYIGEPYLTKFRPDMTEDEMLAVVLQDLDQTFGGSHHHHDHHNNKAARSLLVNYKIVNWSNKPHIRGIYSNQAVPHDDGGPLSVWSQARLLLAGEAFAVPAHHNGWVDGAGLSGLHAADLILKQIDPHSHFSIPQKIWDEEEQ